MDVDVSTREELLTFLAEKVQELGMVARQICAEALEAREDLGSTALGKGVALPHARIDGIDRPIGIFVSLARPIDFEAADLEPVDTAFTLLMPHRSADDQMKVLSQVARIAREEPVMSALRQAGSAGEVVDILRDAEAAA